MFGSLGSAVEERLEKIAGMVVLNVKKAVVPYALLHGVADNWWASVMVSGWTLGLTSPLPARVEEFIKQLYLDVELAKAQVAEEEEIQRQLRAKLRASVTAVSEKGREVGSLSFAKEAMQERAEAAENRATNLEALCKELAELAIVGDYINNVGFLAGLANAHNGTPVDGKFLPMMVSPHLERVTKRAGKGKVQK